MHSYVGKKCIWERDSGGGKCSFEKQSAEPLQTVLKKGCLASAINLSVK